MSWTGPAEAQVSWTGPAWAKMSWTGPAEAKVSWTGPAEAKVSWMGPAEAKVSWTGPAEAKVSWTGPAWATLSLFCQNIFFFFRGYRRYMFPRRQIKLNLPRYSNSKSFHPRLLMHSFSSGASVSVSILGNSCI